MARSKNNYSESISALGLSAGASPVEVKEAYRKLAKQYHPDVYKLDNGEKFKEISSAYRFLKKQPHPPANQNNQSTQQRKYYPRQKDYARRRSDYYRRKRADQAQQKQEMYLWMLKKLKPFVLTVLILNILLTADYLLPSVKEEKKVINYTLDTTRKSVIDFEIRYEYTVLFADNTRGSFEVMEKQLLNREDHYTLEESLLFGTSMKLVHQRTEEEFTPPYSVYNIFGFIIPCVFILQYLYFYRIRNYDLKLGVVAFLIISVLMQISLTFF